MGHRPSSHLFYGYHLPEGVEISDEAADTYCSDNVPVAIGHFGYEHQSAYVTLTLSDKDTDWDGPLGLDLAGLAASLPADADEQILTFAREHGLPAPGEKIDPDSEWDSPASAIGWWLTAAYG